MLARFSLISIFSNASTLIQRIGLSSLLLLFSCEEANYQLDNVSDPWNMDLEPPALFFHPTNIPAPLGSEITVELYGYEIDSAAAARLDIRYDWNSLQFEGYVPGPFFNGDNNPIDIKINDAEGFDIYFYYLPDMNSDQNNGGTWSIATLNFTTISEGRSELKYGDSTELRDSYNNTLEISEMRSGFVDVKDD